MINLSPETFTKKFTTIGSALKPDELKAFIDLLKIQYVEASESLIIIATPIVKTTIRQS